MNHKPVGMVPNHKQVGSDGMDAERPGLSASGCMQPDAVKSNHADMFQPRVYALCGVVVYITKRELKIFERKYENTWFPNDPYQVGGQLTIAAGLVRRLNYHKITSTDTKCIVSLFET